jgi:thiol-disulfide isomerase/thioredoxin
VRKENYLIKNMKRLFILVFVLVSIHCSNLGRGTHGADGFQVTGNVVNTTSSVVTLDELSQEGFQTIDSARIDAKGNFEIKGRVKEPIFCALRFDPNSPSERRIFLVVDSTSKIKVEADYNSMEGYKVKGSKDCELIQQLLIIGKNTQDKMKLLEGKYSGYTMNDMPDSIAKLLRKDYADIMKEQSDAIDKFVTENNTIANYFAAMFLMKDVPFEILQKVDEKGYKKFPESKYAKTMHSYVESRKATATGSMAPEINFPDENGKNLALSSLRGKVVMVDFWASWCGPCRRENPHNVALYKKYHPKGFEIYGVSLDDNKDKWIAALKADSLNWKHVSDLGGWQSKAVSLYNVSSIPATFLLDKDGKIIASGLRGDELEAKLKEIFGF